MGLMNVRLFEVQHTPLHLLHKYDKYPFRESTSLHRGERPLCIELEEYCEAFFVWNDTLIIETVYYCGPWNPHS